MSQHINAAMAIAGLHTPRFDVISQCATSRFGVGHPTPSTHENQRREKGDQKATDKNAQGEEAGEERKEKQQVTAKVDPTSEISRP